MERLHFIGYILNNYEMIVQGTPCNRKTGRFAHYTRLIINVIFCKLELTKTELKAPAKFYKECLEILSVYVLMYSIIDKLKYLRKI
jgi:hypothetical protein